MKNRTLAFVAKTVAAFTTLIAVQQTASAQDKTATWTGWYAGVNAGYGWGNNTLHTKENYFFLIDPKLGIDTRGALGGIQAGYNWQINPSFVLGLESDFDFANLNGQASKITFGGIGATARYDADSKLDWLGTTRARAGFVAGDLLIYGTGGLAYGQVRSSSKLFAISSPPASGCSGGETCFDVSRSKAELGWTVGGGLEYAMWKDVTLRAEYLHVDLGDQKFIGEGLGNVSGSGDFRFDNTYDVVRMGLNLRF